METPFLGVGGECESAEGGAVAVNSCEDGAGTLERGECQWMVSDVYTYWKTDV